MSNASVAPGDKLDYEYSGNVNTVSLPPGKYKLECWGAQGGYRSSSSYGGKGGYSVGELTLDVDTTLYVRSGGAGNTGKTAGGFNGGGKRGSHNGGGGATDIRIGSDSLLARVIVAGGGGSDGASNKSGGYGGGETGQSRTDSYGTGAYGGTQTGVSSSSWQTTAQSTSTTTQAGAYAGFGFGGNGITRSSGYGGAGGGGWYGGSGAYPSSTFATDNIRGGGGGSGFVWTGANAPNGYLVSAKHQLANASTKDGSALFISPTGASETGHSGDGFARITVIELFKMVPDAPSNFTQTSKDYFSISLSWSAVECDGYNLYRNGVLISTQTSTTFTDTDVEPNKTYSYSLTAYNTDGEGEAANLKAKTLEGFAVKIISITDAFLNPNPVYINSKSTLTLKAFEDIKILEPEKRYSGELYAGEV